MKVEHEPGSVRDFNGVIEHCVFCDKPTRYWHMPTNNPVCQRCATSHKVSELKNWLKKSKK